MRVWVLMNTVDSEGSWVAGVYSTIEKAKARLEEQKVKEENKYVDVYVDEWELDGEFIKDYE